MRFLTKARKELLRSSARFELLLLLFLLGGCGPRKSQSPTIEITRVPAADAGGPQKLDVIEGVVRGAGQGQQVVLYAHSGIWWVQPFADRAATQIMPDGTWKNSTHLGTDYAALVVDASFHPSARIESLPAVGGGVIAVATAKGRVTGPIVAKTLHFSGYDWNVRSAGSDRGGEPNAYDPENAWVDTQGFLHLRMGERNGKWTCAEVSLTHNLGYGTYRFVLQDTGHLNPSAVLSLFTWDDVRSEDFRNELDIELSRWGDVQRKNVQYVVQPFYVPENIYRFETPSGTATHLFRWEPGKVTFSSFRGTAAGPGAKPIASHSFTTGVPSPASETVHMDIYDFRHSKHPSSPPGEVVIEKFEYLP